MTPDGWRLTFEFVKTVGVILAGGWALWIFAIQRRFSPQIEFDVDVRILTYSATEHVAEFTMILQNKGLVRHKVRQLVLSVRGLKDGQTFRMAETWSAFIVPERLLSREAAFPREWGYSFVEPGVTQKYAYVSRVPSDLTHLLLIAEFQYRPRWRHTASKVVDVKRQCCGRERSGNLLT